MTEGHPFCKLTRGATPVAPPSAADALGRAGLRVLDVGSERLWSSGKGAFMDTLSQLKRAGVLGTGAGADAHSAWEPARQTVRGVAITVITTTTWSPKEPKLGEAQGHVALADGARLADAIHAAKKAGNVVLVTEGGAAEYVRASSLRLASLASRRELRCRTRRRDAMTRTLEIVRGVR